MLVTGNESTVIAERIRRPRITHARELYYFAPALLGNRVNIAKVSAPGNIVQVGQALQWYAADPAYGNRFVSTGKELVLARNSHSANVRVTIVSTPEPTFLRIGDQILDVPPGETGVFGPFLTTGWRQEDQTYIHIMADRAEVSFAIVQLP